MGTLKGILSWSLASRKLVVFVLSIAATVANAKLGKPLDDAAMTTLLGLVAAWLIGQGIADHGVQGQAQAVARAAKAGGLPKAGAAVAVLAAMGVRVANLPAAVPSPDCAAK